MTAPAPEEVVSGPARTKKTIGRRPGIGVVRESGVESRRRWKMEVPPVVDTAAIVTLFNGRYWAGVAITRALRYRCFPGSYLQVTSRGEFANW
jgi:hypothetical protein